MALISETMKLYNDLIRLVRSSDKLDKYEKQHVIDYLVSVKTGKGRNEFVDDEILANVIYDLCTNYHRDGVDGYFNKAKECIKFLLPYDEKTEDFEMIKKEIINHYIGVDGIFGTKYFNREFYSLFNNSKDYFQIMNIIMSDDDAKDYFDEIVDYAITMGKEIEDYNLFKREIISYIHEVKYNIDDEEAYKEQRVKETRMKYGIYPGLNERTASEISREVEKARSILAKLELMDEKVEEYKKDIDKRTKEGVAKLVKDLETAKKDLKKDLDEYLIYLEDQMKNNSDTVFNGVLESAREKLNQIRLACDTLGNTTTKELIRIRAEADKSVETLKNFASSDDSLKETIEIAKNSEKIMGGLLTLEAQQQVVTPVQGIVVDSAEEDFLVPNFEMTTNILPAFDKTIAFDKRVKTVEQKIKQMEKEGWLIPNSIYEALPWYMLGNKIVYFYGPTQSGKTTLADILTKAVGTDLIDGGKITEEHSVTSFNDVRGKFDENQLFYGLYYGKTVFYDELDNGNPNNLVLLGTYVSQLANKIAHPEKEVKTLFAKRRAVPINANARIIAAGNTTGKGRNREYTARNRFDESTQERIVPIFIGYNEELEKRILNGKTDWYNFFNFFRESCNSWAKNAQMEEAEGNLTTSDASTINEIVNNNAMGIFPMVRGLFTQTKEEDYLGFLVDAMKKKYNINPSEIDHVKLSNTPLDKLKEKDIAAAFVYEATNKEKVKVKRK